MRNNPERWSGRSIRVAVAIAALVATVPSASAQQERALVGRITDGSSGRPLAGVLVEVEGVG
ncbi:MAG: hypothetical protein ACRD15_07030, partial [Vicinamibacterales bacterium]